MNSLTGLYLASNAVLVAVGSSLVGMAARAYTQTRRPAMLHLSIGFVLVVAAGIATAISAFIKGFSGARSLLFVDTALTAVGFLFVMYSLLTYD